MTRFKIGVQLHPQHSTYASYAEAVQTAEALGVDSIWNWDHFFPLYGNPDGNHFEAWTLLSAMATLTHHAEIACLVSCNSYRNPNLLADMARTVDHISGGRLILGIGSGWFKRDYDEYGYEFGTAVGRLQVLEQALPVIRDRLTRLTPPPIRNPLPILIGGGGEKVTLRLVAQYAQLWNLYDSAEAFEKKNVILDEWCKQVGRDPGEIERTAAFGSDGIHDLDAYAAAGATHLILGMGEPWNFAAIERLVAWRDAKNR
jgi:probable F420-dependent oxidoreductase